MENIKLSFRDELEQFHKPIGSLQALPPYHRYTPLSSADFLVVAIGTDTSPLMDLITFIHPSIGNHLHRQLFLQTKHHRLILPIYTRLLSDLGPICMRAFRSPCPAQRVRLISFGSVLDGSRLVQPNAIVSGLSLSLSPVAFTAAAYSNSHAPPRRCRRLRRRCRRLRHRCCSRRPSLLLLLFADP